MSDGVAGSQAPAPDRDVDDNIDNTLTIVNLVTQKINDAVTSLTSMTDQEVRLFGVYLSSAPSHRHTLTQPLFADMTGGYPAIHLCHALRVDACSCSLLGDDSTDHQATKRHHGDRICACK